MKKRVLSVILALVMVLPFVFASCNTKSEEDKMKEIILGTDGETERALTLSLWIPTNVITIEGKTADLGELSQKERKELEKLYPEVYSFLLRVEAVESAINQELISRNYYTNIDIVPVYDEYYDKAVKDRFAYMSELSKPGDMNQRGDSDEYKNDVIEEVVGDSTLYKLLYRPVSSEQLDIFLIRSYDDYANYIKSNSIIPLNSVTETKITVDGEEIVLPATNYISSTGDYKSIYKYIRTEFLDKYEFGKDGLIYALPNNHLFAESYQCILLDKDLVASYDGDIDLNTTKSTSELLKKLKAFVEYSATQKDADGNGYTGLVAKYNQIPTYVFADDNLMFGCDISSDKLNFIYEDPTYLEYISIYRELNEKGLIFDSAIDEKKFAARFVNLTADEMSKYENDYVVFKASNPIVADESLFSSMFAISTYSLDFDRSMKILFLLQSDEEIRTLLQYGIEDEDYVIITTKDENGNKIETISLRDTAYNGAFEIKYTGNSYYTFPGNNTQISDWEYVKGTNLVSTTGKFFNYSNFAKYQVELSDDEKAILNERYDELVALIQSTTEQVKNMSNEDYQAFLEVYAVDILSKYEEIANFENSLKTYYEDLENAKVEVQFSLQTEGEKITDATEREEFYSLVNQVINYIEQLDNLYENNASEKEISDLNDIIYDNQAVVIIKSNTMYSKLDALKTAYSNLRNERAKGENAPKELEELNEKSPVAFELKASQDFSIIKKTYTDKALKAFIPPTTEEDKGDGGTTEDTENTEQAE